MTSIRVDSGSAGEPYRKYWNVQITSGRAYLGLREDYRDHLRQVQEEIGFDYIRFHGLFHDDMMVYHERSDGTPYYNWQYIDNLFDFLLSVGIRPIAELAPMPHRLAGDPNPVPESFERMNMNAPKDMVRWEGLVNAFVRHCVNRYGLSEVKTWYFELWNEPMGHLAQATYFDMYRHTVRAVKSVDPALRVGGPASSNFETNRQTGEMEAPWVKDFIRYCAAEKLAIDFISVHPYPTEWPRVDGEVLELYRPAFATVDDLKWLRKTIDESPFPNAELHLTEWTASPQSRDVMHDTAFMASFVLANNIKGIGLVDSLGFWVFSDVFEEAGAGDTPFHGGYGMLSYHGLKKPAYHGYWFLSRLGEEKLACGEDHFVTRDADGNVQIVMWNYAHLKEGYYYNHTKKKAVFGTGSFHDYMHPAERNTSMFQINVAASNADPFDPSHLDRYGIFEEKPPADFQIRIDGVAGEYKVFEYVFDRAHGSVFDRWIENGASWHLDEEEVRVLALGAEPAASVRIERLDGSYTAKRSVEPFGITFIELRRQL